MQTATQARHIIPNAEWRENQSDGAKSAQEIAHQPEMIALEAENTKYWEKLLTASEAPQTEQPAVEMAPVEQTPTLEIGGVTEITFNSTETPSAPLEQPTPVTEPQPVLEATPAPATQTSPEEPKLVDFRLFGNFVSENAYKGVSTIATKASKFASDLSGAVSGLFSEFIFFKVLTPEEQKKADEKKKKEHEKAANKKQFYDGLRQGATNQEQLRGLQEKAKAASGKLGMNASFEGSIVNGQIRKDLEQELNKKEAEGSDEERKKAQRSRAAAMAGGKSKAGKKANIDDMNLATEKQSHWSKAIG